MRLSTLTAATQAQTQLFDSPPIPPLGGNSVASVVTPLTPHVAPATPGAFKPTAEMQCAVDKALTGKGLKIVAYAGAGKTSTLVSIAHAMPRSKRGVYSAFNKSIATEAGQRFPSTVKCSTFHSLAYRATAHELLKKLQYPRLPGHAIAQMYNVQRAKIKTVTNQDAIVEAHLLGGIIADTAARFCRTAAREVLPEHVRLPDALDAQVRAELMAQVVPLAQRHWNQTLNARAQVPLSHDAYLKAWALSDPVINADYILFDEAQDADGVMLEVLGRQQSQVIYVGDPYQQIYEWRGAVNALGAIRADEAYLTQSFRFGPPIAHAANILLGFLGEQKPLLGSPGRVSRVEWSDQNQSEPVDALLCRTNATGIREAVAAHGRRQSVCLQVNTAEILGFAEAAATLQAGGQPWAIEYQLFRDWNDLVDFSETTAGAEFKPNVKLVTEHGINTLRDAINRSVPANQASLTISTAHRAKGLEWDRVRLADDFRLGRMVGDEYVFDEAEARLDYVALTRARRFVDVSSMTELIDEATRMLKRT